MGRPTIGASADERILAPTPAAIARAAALVRAGKPVAFPTETVYGLAADATNDAAVAAVFALKHRPQFNPLIVHMTDSNAARLLAVFDGRAERLAAAFWPGPLTLVARRRESAGLSLLVSAGLDTVALRAPRHPVAQALLVAAEVPIAAPSANRSGTVSPTTARHVADSFGDAAPLVLDGGACAVGLESTVVDVSGIDAALLRPGAITAEAIEALIGPLAAPATDADAPRSPGMLTRHYAPGRPLRLNAERAYPGEVLLGFGPDTPDATLNLSPSGDLVEAAANLFAMLRALDRPDIAAIAVMPIPTVGLGHAINDRLTRAAAPPDHDDTGWDGRGPATPCVLPDSGDE